MYIYIYIFFLDAISCCTFTGLMISAYAKAGQILNDHSYTERALLAVRFVRTHMFKSGVLLRSCYASASGDNVTQT